MKRINAHWFKGRTGVDTRRRNPKPFPGKYPTRIQIKCTRGAKVVWEYTGKPSNTAFVKMRKELRGYVEHGRLLPTSATSVFAMEFDRGGPITDTLRAMPRTTLPVSHYNMALLQYYHPWTYVRHDQVFSGFHNTPVRFKKIRFNGKVRNVYSPHDRLSVVDHLQPYKAFLRTLEL